MRTAGALIIGAVFILGACGAPAASGGTVAVTLNDNTITPSVTSITAGPVTFSVKNIGKVEHELVVLKTNLAPDKIPDDKEEPGKVDETGNVGETGEVAPGSSKEFTVILTPGSYVLLCNEIGHYALGMRLGFTVK